MSLVFCPLCLSQPSFGFPTLKYDNDDAGDGDDDDDGDKVDGVVVGGDGDGDNGDGETASAVPFGFSHFPAVSFVASLSRLSVRLFYTLCTAVFNTHFDCGIVLLLDILALISRASLIHCIV